MAETAGTDVQEPPGVSPRAVLLPVLFVFAVAAAVMAIIALAFWIKLGILPTGMARVTKETFPQPQLQVEPLRDLSANRAEALRRLGGEPARTGGDDGARERSAMSIAAAMAAVAARADPYAPLLDEHAVPDSAGFRAMVARRAARSGGEGSRNAVAGDAALGATAGAQSGAFAPPASLDEPSSVPGLSGESVRVPAISLQGTPTYDGIEDDGAVTR